MSDQDPSIHVNMPLQIASGQSGHNLDDPLRNSFQNHEVLPQQEDYTESIKNFEPRHPLFTVTKWIRDAKKNWLDDFIAGLTVAAIQIPQSLAFTTITGLPTYYGLYCAIIPCFVYAIFGTSRHVANGPVALVCLLLQETLVGFSDINDKVTAAILCSFIVGALCIICGIFRMGYMANCLAKSSMAGFLTGLGINIMTSQFPLVFQQTYTSNVAAFRIYETFSLITQMSVAGLVTGIITVILLLGMEFLKYILKSKSILFLLSRFFILVLGTIIFYAADLDKKT
jgi:SulP family sulfate permease